MTYILSISLVRTLLSPVGHYSLCRTIHLIFRKRGYLKLFRTKPSGGAQIVGANGQAADALSRRREDRIRDRRSGGWHARLAAAGWGSLARNDIDLDHRRFAHAQHRIRIEIRLLHGAIFDRDLSHQRR